MRIAVVLVGLIVLIGIALFVVEQMVQPDIVVVREEVVLSPTPR